MLCLILILLWCLWHLYRSMKRKLPGPKLGILSPIRHLVFAWRGDLHLDVLRLHRQKGPVIQYAPSKVLFNTIAACNLIYGHESHLLKSEGYLSQSFDREQTTLFNCINPDWTAAKKQIIGSIFASKKVIDHHAQSIDTHTQRLLAAVCGGQPCEMSSIAFRFSLDVMSYTVLGSSLDLLRASENRWLCQSLLSGNRHMYLQMAWPKLFAMLQMLIHPTRLTYPSYFKDSANFLTLMEDKILQAEQDLETRDRQSSSVCSVVEHMRRNTFDEAVTDDEMKIEAYSLLRAGGDTVAAAIAACLFYLGRNLECQRNASREVRSAFARPDLIVYGPVLQGCTYLRACLDEAMRMSPPAPGVFFRQCSQDCVIDSVFVKAGTNVAVGVHALHHNPDYFSKPFIYRPERFCEQGGREAFVPFLKGYRSCPAQKFAYPMMLVPLAHLLWSFEFKPVTNLGGGRPHVQNSGPHGEGVFQLHDSFASSVKGPLLTFEKRSV